MAFWMRALHSPGRGCESWEKEEKKIAATPFYPPHFLSYAVHLLSQMQEADAKKLLSTSQPYWYHKSPGQERESLTHGVFC